MLPIWERPTTVRLIKWSRAAEYFGEHPDAEQALRAWHRELKQGDWQSPHDVAALYRSADFVGNNRVVFNICGNKYRMVVEFNYKAGVAYLRFLGTHKEYDEIDVTTVR